MVRFVELPSFTRYVTDTLADDEYRRLQMELVIHPDMGVVVPGTGGVRKIRWRRPGMGKRGGYRVVYYYRVSEMDMWMLAI